MNIRKKNLDDYIATGQKQDMVTTRGQWPIDLELHAPHIISLAWPDRYLFFLWGPEK